MKSLKFKKLVAWVALAAMLLSITACSSQTPKNENSGTEPVEKKTIQVLDSANRTVEVPYPAKSVVVLWNNPTEMIGALGATNRIVGMDTSTKEDVDKGFYPELKDVPVIGSCEDPNYEMIAKLDPDVVIMLSTYPPLPDEVQKQLESFDIPVVALDFFRTDVFYRELTTLGNILGLEDKAAELVSFFEKPMNQISSVVSQIPDKERKTVYFEAAADYKTYGGAGYGCGIPGMIRDAGGIDLYPEISAATFDVNPEDIAQRNPDVIFKGKGGGYLLKEADFKEVYDALVVRPELAKTTAAQKGEEYVISFDIAGGARKIFGPMYLAKIMYPEKLKDFDPDAILQEYLKTYLGRPWQGTYVYTK